MFLHLAFSFIFLSRFTTNFHRICFFISHFEAKIKLFHCLLVNSEATDGTRNRKSSKSPGKAKEHKEQLERLKEKVL